MVHQFPHFFKLGFLLVLSGTLKSKKIKVTIVENHLACTETKGWERQGDRNRGTPGLSYQKGHTRLWGTKCVFCHTTEKCLCEKKVCLPHGKSLPR